MVRLSRVGIVHLALLLFAAALLLRAAQVQLWQGDAWAARAVRQQFKSAELPAPRGDILDATGVALARSRELVRLHVAPRESRDLRALRRALARAGVPRRWAEREVTRKRRWVGVPGQFLPADAAPLLAMRGVYGEPVAERIYARSDGARRLVGRATLGGVGTDGLELALDSLLRGTAGRAMMLRDARGRSFESPTAPGTAPEPGHTVVLTLNYELQEIADRALADAVARLGADGGDIVVLDPHDGAVLAVASRRAVGRVGASTALSEPFEPGSTLKPFIAAALLSRGRARPHEMIATYGGTYTVHGRTITDTHRAAALSLRDVIAWSSNVGIVRFAERLTPGEQYQTLRDLGFGTPTGVPYPAEAAGTLRAPAAWSKQSPASLAMGYEIAVTPLQLAAAYATVANGGELLEPALVREVRAPDGSVRFRHRRRVVRRVMEPEVARTVRRMLAGTVEEGTAVRAELATFAVAGKTGTARRFVGRGYAAEQYIASFVGLFPADDPQFVIVVKLDSPAGDFYGGKTAAPVSKVVLEAALAARDAALNRAALAAPRWALSGADADEAALEAARDADAVAAAARPATGAASVGAVHLVALAAPSATPALRGAPRPVPDVRGLPLRGAVRALHRAGFQVRLAPGAAGTTSPAAGALAAPGAVVRLARGR